IYEKFNEDGGLRCPQVLVLAPDATLEGRVSPGLKPEIAAILNLARATQARLGRGLTDLELASVKDALARAARAEKAGKSGSMWRAFGDVLSVAPDGPRALVAEEGQKRAEEALAKQRDAATEKLGSGDGLEGWLALEELAKDWTPSEQAAELTRIMKRAEKEPLLRDALAKKRREDEAQALWNEAEAARSANQPKEAERKLRLLLKKYPGTPAGERVAKAHPDWTAP
ncbi:MAG TPA: hypothetical protein VM509_09700, partial [Planctomycetota bacterium]|nr:hypothetical protein [Planctomycetota bacterium]